MEKIICSTIHFQDGKEHVHQPKNITTGFVECGRRHHNCYKTLQAIGSSLGHQGMIKELIDRTGRDCQGFLTDSDRFVDRAEGMSIAKKAGQLLNAALHEDNSEAILTSEDLYSEDLY